jgi:phage shock protein PspC (stress-responsive transcriptional regulator)
MSEHITHTQGIKRLERSSSDRMLAGVSGGLGRYFDLNPAFFRLGFVVLTVLGGAGILTYLAAVLVIPEEGAEQSIAARVLAERRQRPWPMVGLGLVAAALLVLLSRSTFWPVAGAGWVIVLIAGLAILWTYDAGRGTRRARRLFYALLTLVALALAVLVASIVSIFAWFHVSLSDGVGDRFYAPATAAAVQPSYSLGVGKLRLDLSNAAAPVGVRVRVGVGELRVIVPRGTAVAVNAHATVGDVRVFNQQEDGRDVSISTGSGAAMTIDASVGAGRIDVVRAQR